MESNINKCNNENVFKAAKKRWEEPQMKALDWKETKGGDNAGSAEDTSCARNTYDSGS